MYLFIIILTVKCQYNLYMEIQKSPQYLKGWSTSKYTSKIKLVFYMDSSSFVFFPKFPLLSLKTKPSHQESKLLCPLPRLVDTPHPPSPTPSTSPHDSLKPPPLHPYLSTLLSSPPHIFSQHYPNCISIGVEFRTFHKLERANVT